MKAISKNRFNPFNHGTTRIIKTPVLPNVFHKLDGVLYDNWGMRAHIITNPHCTVEIPNPNFIVETKDREIFLLRRRNHSADIQELFTRMINEAIKEGVPTLYPVHTNGGKPFSVDGERIWVLYKLPMADLKSVEYFDGSKVQIRYTANALARLHKALYRISVGDTIKLRGQKNTHDRAELEHLIKIARSAREGGKFERDLLEILNEVDETSQKLAGARLGTLPIQVIHYNFFPHNAFYNPTTNELAAILGLDHHMPVSQRLRDVAWSMHRFARTYGEDTEGRNDVGADILVRAKLFLAEYTSILELTPGEMKAIPKILQDEAIIRVMIIMRLHYKQGNTDWDFDLGKQLTTMRESILFNEL